MSNQNQILRIGILSTAEIAHKVVLAIQESKNAKAIAVASRSLEKAQKWGLEHNINIHYGSYQELVESKEVDAIYIPLPTALKKEWAIKSAKAKKSILLEKPLPGVENVDDLVEIIQACKENNVQFLDGTMWLHSLRTQSIQQKLEEKVIGNLKRVIASFTFLAPNEEWLHGGNGRTDKTREPMGCFGDQGWYPLGAIMLAYNYELPTKVQMNFVELNKVDTIIACSGTLWFSNNKMAHFDCGVTACHRSQFEIVGEQGTIRVEDQVGGQGRSGDFDAYFINYKGSNYYKMDDVQGKETIVKVEESNHTQLMIENFSSNVISQNIDESWPKKSLNCQKVLVALFKSAENNNQTVNLE